MLILGPIERIFTFSEDGKREITERDLEKNESRCWYTRGLMWTYKDKGVAANVAGWGNQMDSVILDG